MGTKLLISSRKASEMNFSCDVMQGFNFQKDAQCLIGHLSKLEISTATKVVLKLICGCQTQQK